MESAQESNENEILEQGTVSANEARAGRPKRGRKRKFKHQSRADRKKLLNKNKKHINTKGETVDAKVFDQNFICRCPKKCTEVVSSGQREKLFNQFWDIGSPEGRWALLVSCVSEFPKKRSYTKTPSKRTVTRKYSMYGQDVCQVAFLRTLQINVSRVELAINKKLHSDTYADLRGQYVAGWNAHPPSKKDEVCAHIAKFPKYVSHYTRSQTESKFLSQNLNLLKMYDLYKSETENPVSKSVYKDIFYKNFNLRFKKPKKDTCKTCDIYIAKIKSATGEERLILDKIHNAHLETAELLSNQMKADLEMAKTDPKMEAASFDQQKTHPLPRLTTNVAYYKRQLNLYNLGINVGSSGKGIFNIWLEIEASKGTQEVGSCLKKYIQTIIEPVEKLILWADSCGGQNRSIKLVLILMHVLQNHSSLKTISLRFLKSGHSFMPNDSQFGDVECYLKTTKDAIYTDSQYMQAMIDCRNDNKFDVQRMASEEFFSVELLLKAITNRKIDCNKSKINWLHTHEIVIDKSEPFIMKMKKTLDGPSQIVSIAKTKGNYDFGTIELEKLWPMGRPLSKEKVEDLMAMTELIPDEWKSFYAFIEGVPTKNFTDDLDGFGESVDFEVEELED